MDSIARGLSIRSANTTDEHAITQIFQDAIASMQTAGVDQWDGLYPSANDVRRDIELNAGIIAAFRANIVAYAAMDRLQSRQWSSVPWTLPGPALCVHRLVVTPSVQRQGIASTLMNHIESYGRSAGFAAIRLDAFSGSWAATGLYVSLGYSRAGTVTFRKGSFLCFEKSLRAE